MKRRELIGALCSATVAWPLRVAGQTRTMPVVGILSTGAIGSRTIPAFLDGLRELGYVKDRNVVIEYRLAEEHYERLPPMAAELVALHVSLIATVGGEAAALAAQAATPAIPIVFTVGSDPVKIGLVASLNRPGKNITGTSMLNATLVPKQFELLHELQPASNSVALLVNPNSGFAEFEAAGAMRASSAIGQRLIILKATNEEEINSAFDHLAEQRTSGLVVSSDIIFGRRSDHLVALAAHHSVCAVYPWPQYAAAGGLMTYGPDLDDAYRQCGIYAGRILKGEKPADLPVIQPTKFLLRINLKTARSLGLTIPPALLARADKVIE